MIQNTASCYEKHEFIKHSIIPKKEKNTQNKNTKCGLDFLLSLLKYNSDSVKEKHADPEHYGIEFPRDATHMSVSVRQVRALAAWKHKQFKHFFMVIKTIWMSVTQLK